MDAATIGNLKAYGKRNYAKGVYGLRNVVGWWDASTLAGSNGAALSKWPDLSGMGMDAAQFTGANQPTLKVSGTTRTVNFASGQYLVRNGFGNGDLAQPVGFAQPITMIAVAKAASSFSSLRTIVGGSGAGVVNLLINSVAAGVGGHLQVNAGSGGASGDRNVADDTWHVFVGLFDTHTSATFIDGYLSGVYGDQQHGTNAMKGLGIGSQYEGGSPFNGEIAEVIVVNDRVSFGRLAEITQLLSAKWGLGLTVPAQDGVTREDTTDSASQNVSLWMPKTLGASTPLVIWSHQAGGNEQISPNFNHYSLVHACVNKGWMFAASRMHSDSWGNNTALTDLANLYTLVNGRQPVSDIILVGSSMGGVATALAVALGTVPNVRGAIGIDAVFNLANMHANASYTAAIDTAYGSNYAANAVGHDPVLRSASDFTGIPWRFYSSPSDTTVPPASHVDQFRTLIAASTHETTKVSHVNGHLASQGVQPSDAVAFISRCLARTA